MTRWAGQNPTWGRPSPQVRVESQCSYSKFLWQQWQLANNSKNGIAFCRRTTWHMDLRQLTVYEHFRWVNMRAITFLFVGQSSSRVWLWGYPTSGGLIRWILGQILNFHDQKFFFWGGPSSPFRSALTRLGQSLARMKIWGGSTP